MNEQPKQSEQVLELVRQHGVLRPRDLDTHGIPRSVLSRLHHEGLLYKPNRGLYVLSDSHPTELRSIAEACKRMPNGVICLLSALRFHELTTESPFEVWMAIDSKAWRPKSTHPPLRIVHFSGKALTAGVEEHSVEGVPVRIYAPAKTVADCFKFRNKIGLNIAIEALRECLHAKRCTMDELWQYARICRVHNVMKPYLESLAI